MVEEFQESDVIFSDEYDSSSSNECDFSSRDRTGLPGSKVRKQKRKLKHKSGSVPIRIPRTSSAGSSTDSDEYEEEGSVTPPHLIVARRIEERMACGYGRPLKGREMSEVRNSILRMTGFLET
uniref:Uncharacterized protein n=1 Tax=Kalanchoe fedtschenkoi TaxID=63787 RepID=A0A7N0SWF6_KALFE